MLNQSVAMAPAIYPTTRLKWGNVLFPAVIEITDQEVICVKKYGFFKRKTSISIRNIASIHIRNSQFSSELLFKNHNGGPPLTILGVQKADARRIREKVERIMGL